eukprot:CAMPEP_0171214130 /NCGR_PEP_ID=MMETSP0790-20130122/30999_1 /TAXON_ID=2925 /ORGANISM="Alexandrium catenella, Strain OF101" /LENGTH=194 /DNA_ID=CAMNT_0011679855 /DNA_START=93 /DNA_END=677 /DNA_ORIENTATION=-
MGVAQDGGDRAAHVEDVLQRIREAQEGSRSGYARALREIETGQKQSHWIWYVWPTMVSVRDTSRPEFSLPDFAAVRAYLECPILSHRLLEITAAAEEHLRAGQTAHHVLGSRIDAKKFRETMTFFAVAAAHSRNAEQARVFLSALNALSPPGRLDEATMDALAKEEGSNQYASLRHAQDIEAMLSRGPGPGDLL